MLTQILDRLDLFSIHAVLTLAGALMAIYVMQLTSHEHEDNVDPPVIRWIRRVAYGAITLSLLWSLNYSEAKSWQPWPPEIALIVSVILILVVRAAAIHARIRREGHRRDSPASSNSVLNRIRN